MIAFLLVIDLRASGPPMLEKHRNRKQEPKGGGVTLCSLPSDADVLPKENCFEEGDFNVFFSSGRS